MMVFLRSVCDMRLHSPFSRKFLLAKQPPHISGKLAVWLHFSFKPEFDSFCMERISLLQLLDSSPFTSPESSITQPISYARSTMNRSRASIPFSGNGANCWTHDFIWESTP